jgi:hypothetical protein
LAGVVLAGAVAEVAEDDVVGAAGDLQPPEPLWHAFRLFSEAELRVIGVPKEDLGNKGKYRSTEVP